jgi:hypothetical protein
MRQVHRPFVFAAISIIAVACSAPTATAPASATAEPTPPVSASPVESSDESSAPAATPEPIPSDQLGPFTCDLPLHESATVAPPANITDVRTGTHEGFDRVVFEFTDGLPEASLEGATPPFTHDASGEPIDVQGASFLRLIMRGGTKQTDEGTSSYDGPTEFETGYPALVHLIEGGDFEAQSTWYFGLAAESCVRILTLTDEGSARLVIDIEH